MDTNWQANAVSLNGSSLWGTLVFEFQDRRVSLGAEERRAECDLCGTHLVLLPNDKRECRCFDCLRKGPDTSMDGS